MNCRRVALGAILVDVNGYNPLPPTISGQPVKLAQRLFTDCAGAVEATQGRPHFSDDAAWAFGGGFGLLFANLIQVAIVGVDRNHNLATVPVLELCI